MNAQSGGTTPLGYARSAVRRLPHLWNDKEVNRNAMRAVFRRWRPDVSGEPTMDMRSYIWGILGTPIPEPEGEEDDRDRAIREHRTNEAVDHAAIIVALRAVAGESEGPDIPFGQALHQAGMSDRRFARLVTMPKKDRLEAVRRALQLVARSGAAIDWTRETGRFYYFLFGKPEYAKRSADMWATDFFRTRSKAEEKEDAGE